MGWGGGLGALVGTTAAAKGATAELRQRLAAELSGPNELAARWLTRGAKPLVPLAARLVRLCAVPLGLGPSLRTPPLSPLLGASR